MRSRQGSRLKTQATLCRGPSITECPPCLRHLSGAAQPGRQQGQSSMDRCLGRDGHSVPGFTAGSVERSEWCCMFRPVARQSASCRHRIDGLGASGHLGFLHRIRAEPCDTGHVWGVSQPCLFSLPPTFVPSKQNGVTLSCPQASQQRGSNRRALKVGIG